MGTAVNGILDKILTATVLAVVVLAVFFGVRSQLGNVIAEGVVPGNPETKSLALSAEGISPNDPKTLWLASVSRHDELDRKSSLILSNELKKVILRSPHDFRWWIERGKALEKARRIGEAEAHLAKAVSLAPNYGAPRWHLGNFYLRTARQEQSIEHFSVAARGDAQYREEIFALIDDFFDDSERAFARIVGDDPEMLVTLSRYHAARGNRSESLATWNRLSADDKRRLSVFGMEIAQGNYDRRAYIAASSILRDLGKESNTPGQISNGGFEVNLGNAKDVFFGWRVTSRERVDVRLDGRNSRDGRRSLRISYDGTVQEFVGNALQILVIKPGKRYRINYWVRGEGIRSAGPPRIDVIDLASNRVIASGDSMKGSFDWTQQGFEFDAPEEEEGVLLVINREGCGAECPIYGLLWLDGFELREVQ